MVARATAQVGNWNTPSTWVGGVVPIDGDGPISINHNVIFDANQSAWVTGLVGDCVIAAGVTLSVSSVSSSHMKMGANCRWVAAQAATRLNPARFRCGTDMLNGLPAAASFTLTALCNISRNALFTSDILRATYGVLDVVCTDGYPRPIRFATCAVATNTTTLVVRLHNTANRPLSLSVGETIFIANGTSRTSFAERVVNSIVNNNDGTMTLTLASAPGFTIAKGALIAVTTSNVLIDYTDKTGTLERSVFGGLVNAPLRCLVKGADIVIDSGFVNQGGHSSGCIFEGWAQQTRISFRAGSGYIIRNGGGHHDANGLSGSAKQCTMESAAFAGGGTVVPINSVYGQTRIVDNEFGQATIFSFVPYIFTGQSLWSDNGSVVCHNTIAFFQNNRATQFNDPPTPEIRFRSMHWIESFITAGFGFACAIDSSGNYNAYRGSICTDTLILDYVSGTPFLGPSTLAASIRYGDAGERGISRFQAERVIRIAGPTVSGAWLALNRFAAATPNAAPAFPGASQVVFSAATNYESDGYFLLAKQIYAHAGAKIVATIQAKMDTVFGKQPWRVVIYDPAVSNIVDTGGSFVAGSTAQPIGSAEALANTNLQSIQAVAIAPRSGAYCVAVLGAANDSVVGWLGTIAVLIAASEPSMIGRDVFSNQPRGILKK